MTDRVDWVKLVVRLRSGDSFIGGLEALALADLIDAAKATAVNREAYLHSPSNVSVAEYMAALDALSSLFGGSR